MNAKISKRPNQSNCSTSGYSSQISDLSCDAKRSLSLSSVCLSEPKIIRTSTPSNLVSTLQIGSLSTISSIQKAESAKTGLVSSLIKFILSLFSCFNIFKHSTDSSELSFDTNMPKIVLRQQKLSAPPVRQQAACFAPPGPELTCQVRTKIRQNSFISSTPNRPSYNSFMFIDEKEIYDNMHSIESSQTSFNKAKYTVNTEVSSTSFGHDKIKSVPLLSSSPLYANNLVSSQSVSSSVMSSSSAAASCSLQTSSSSFTKYPDPIYSSNFKKGFQTEDSSTERRVVPVYEDYLCDKEVESYFENPDYFDCYTNEVLIVKSAGKIYTQNFACYDGHSKCAKTNNYLYLSNEHKCKSASTSSGIVSGATSASISTLSSIKSNNSIMNYGGVIRQYKGESYC
ncbi:hypothetical protein BpHYR1_028341 [Brachionus plicatilis]|uniref:Uncharacterized protein n=1 Tax=Brachionus plicatilis TaxID=10195 RepID=A0A3M7P9Q0_BRAPC|nr:hypothetical protein BpHYR1_028341 [Brachionus plicatilis]